MDKQTSVVLIGMMGSSKTTTGRILAGALSLPFYDSDEQYVLRFHESIADTFAAYGEAVFREREREVMSALAEGNRGVLALGGGAVLHNAEMEKLRRIGRVVFLNTDAEVLEKRLSGDRSRPLLSGGGRRIKTIVEERLLLYRQYADITIDNSQLTPEETAQVIIRELTKIS